MQRRIAMSIFLVVVAAVVVAVAPMVVVVVRSRKLPFIDTLIDIPITILIGVREVGADTLRPYNHPL